MGEKVMRTGNWITFSLLLLLLASCVTRPRIKPQVRCFNQYNFDYGTPEERAEFFANIEQYKDDPEAQEAFLKEVLAIFGKGRCNVYDLEKAEAVDPNAGYDVPLVELDLYGGFYFDDWAREIRPWAKESIQYFKDSCTNGQRRGRAINNRRGRRR